jgi:nucleotide-binding universal stress UspA family protein
MSNSNEVRTFTDQAPHLGTSEILVQRLVVASDFSKQADTALKLATTIAHRFGSTIYLVHAIRPPLYPVDGVLIPELVQAQQEAASADMQDLIERDPDLKALQPETRIGYGDPVQFVRQVSLEEKADLIVVGSHGASGLERLALGSVAEGVLHKATCPVLIAGPRCRVENHLFRSVVFATDLKTTGLRGAQYAAGFAERHHGKLTFLHVMNRKYIPPGLEPESVRERIREQLRQLFPGDVDEYCKSQIRLEYGEPAEVISAVAQSESANLLVVGLRDSALADHAPWSTLSHIIREATCPVLGVRGHFV